MAKAKPTGGQPIPHRSYYYYHSQSAGGVVDTYLIKAFLPEDQGEGGRNLSPIDLIVYLKKRTKVMKPQGRERDGVGDLPFSQSRPMRSLPTPSSSLIYRMVSSTLYSSIKKGVQRRRGHQWELDKQLESGSIRKGIPKPSIRPWSCATPTIPVG